MSKDRLDEIEKKKRELQAELKRIQHELDDSIDGVRTDVSNRLQPSEFIKKYPLPVVGLSVFVGFLVGREPGSRYSSGRGESGESFGSTLFSELKKLATRKAVSFATDYLENILADNPREVISTKNGTATTEE